MKAPWKQLRVITPLATAVGLALWLFWPSRGEGAAAGAGSAATHEDLGPAGPAGSPRTTSSSGSAVADPSPGASLPRMGWGGGAGEIGRKHPVEGNPEGPMSFTVDARGEALIVDQVNGRLLRFDRDGSRLPPIRIGESAQDVAAGRDGTIAVLDRLVDRSVTLHAPDGRALGTLPVVGKGITEGGQVTGVFVDGNDVYVEREHGQLVRIGDTSGDAGGERTEIPGRPTRDGSSYVSAGIDGGRVYLTAIARAANQHRYTRALPFNATARAILLLDTDLAGTVYVAATVGAPDGSESEWLACVALADGKTLGTVEVTPNTLPEETFREFTVLDQGGVLHAELSDQGVAYVRYDCR